MPDSRSHLVVIGGRSGVGKTSVAAEMHEQLAAAKVQHALIEGDALDLAWPAPWEHGLEERNLAAIWRNYRELGYRRLIYTNTVSVLEIKTLADAMGDDPQVTAILLICNDDTAAGRLSGREIGSGLDTHIARSSQRAQELNQHANEQVIRVATDSRDVIDIAREVIEIAGWNPTDEGQNDYE